MAFSRSRFAILAAILVFSSNAFAARTESGDVLPPQAQPSSLAGSYLAGRSADIANDVDAALAYYSYALEADPGNPLLSERVLLLQLAAGEIESAVDLAEKLAISDPRNPTARLTLAAAALRDGNFALAKSELGQSANSPLAVLTGGLLEAWADQGAGDTDQALKSVQALTGPGWYDIFKSYHRALIADAAGRMEIADAAIAVAYQADNTPLRIVDAYARIKARAGKKDEALEAIANFVGESTGHPVMRELRAEIESGQKPEPIAGTAQAGAAEVLYGLGSAIGTEESAGLAAAYLQLAHYLAPDVDLIVVALGDIFQRAEQCDKAIEIYDRVADSSVMHRNAAIQTAICLDALGRTDEGARQIKRILDENQDDIEAAMALGNLYRSHDRFAEAAEAFTIGIEAIEDESQADWRIYYFRGVAYERTKRWPEAESDLKQALELNPDQPQVLNYLGYSWVDQGLNLDKALEMIQTAVELRPNDGYIVDSLGWAYYRLGRYDDAVEQLERAVELRPEDPVINDHLGDALWKVGRKREAKFQWLHARDLDPETAELPKILNKIQNGLAEQTKMPTRSEQPATVIPAALEKTIVAATNPADEIEKPSSITVEMGESLSAIAQRVYGNPELYVRIFEANRDRISDPDQIFPGMTLTIPSTDEE